MGALVMALAGDGAGRGRPALCAQGKAEARSSRRAGSVG